MIVETDFFTHWKTQMLGNLLNDSGAPMCVLKLWAHAQNRRVDRFEGMRSEVLKAVCGYDGDADVLKSALIEAGFVVLEGDCLVLHGFRERNAKLFANWKNGGNGGRPGKANDNPQETQQEPIDYPDNNRTETHSEPNDNPRQTHKEPIREEKSRVDKNRNNIETRSTVVSNSNSLPVSPINFQDPDFLTWLDNIRNIKPTWKKFGLKADEMRIVYEVYKGSDLTDDDFELFQAYYASKLTEDSSRKPFFRWDGMVKFLSDLGTMLDAAERWKNETDWESPERRRKRAEARRVINQSVEPEEAETDYEAASEMLRKARKEIFQRNEGEEERNE